MASQRNPLCTEAPPAAPASRISGSQELSAPWQARGGLAAPALGRGCTVPTLYPEVLGVFLSHGGPRESKAPPGLVGGELGRAHGDRTARAPIHPGLTLRGQG